MHEWLNARMLECEMTEWCEAILIKIYQNNEGTEQNFARLLQMLIRTKINFARLVPFMNARMSRYE
jgi:hypothetical protein